jgi:outer membrane protein OmpA-like peptidoglycan-associated protein
LGLSITDAVDGFGNKFGYIVDSNFKDALANNFYGANNLGSIVVKSYNGAFVDVNLNALFAIISYGANGNYAYGANSATSIAPAANDIYEQKNSPANLSDHLLVQTSASSSFDDIVFYKDKDNFLRDAKSSTLIDPNISGPSFW